MTGAGHVRGVETREMLMSGPLGAVLLLGPQASDGRFSLVEHPLVPRALGAPVHTHRNEDEYSFVLEGTIGVEIDGKAFQATAGDVVVKQRGIPHAFWNASDAPARLLELIVPAGFERYFVDLGQILGRPGPPDLAALGELGSRYGLEFDPESIPRLAAQHGLDLGAGR
ncbi:MAG: cupin domain-containing protein [Candidatus Limnocylindria bacterium]